MAKQEQHTSETAMPRTWFGSRNITASIVVFLVIASAVWYQWGTESLSLDALKSNIFSLATPAKETAGTLSESELSTADAPMPIPASGGNWEIRRSESGESVWSVYQAMLAGTEGLVFRAQAVNGLKNATLVKNGIAAGAVAHSSLELGKDYSFLSKGSVDNYVKRLTEANLQIDSGTALGDLSPELQLAYKLANAPSYDYVYSLSADDIASVF